MFGVCLLVNLIELPQTTTVHYSTKLKEKKKKTIPNQKQNQTKKQKQKTKNKKPKNKTKQNKKIRNNTPIIKTLSHTL